MDCPDPNSGGEKSLPGMGMGLPKWMKRTTERYDYSDICASPPSNEDGFFHMNRSRIRQGTASGGQSNATVECYQNQKRRVSGAKTSPDLTSAILEVERQGQPTHQQEFGPIPSTAILSKKDCSNIPETSSFFKTVSTTSSSFVNLAAASQAGLVTQPTQSFTTTSDTTVSVLRGPKSSASSESYSHSRVNRSSAHDSALSQADIPTMIVTKPDREISSANYKQLVEKMKDAVSRSPDATPNATPTVTPACSPQAPRRGNPFFTGSTQPPANNSGSWLFRPPSTVATTDKAANESGKNGYMYEAKVDIQRPLSASAGPGVVPSGMNSTKQKVRYVPRPSEMRELNFWSPTSM